MKIRSGCVCAFILIFLSSLFAFVPRASAQGHVVDQPGVPTKRHRKAANARQSMGLAPASAYRVLYNFCTALGCSDGVFPPSGLIQDVAGNLYGTTVNGGIFTVTCSGGGCGTVFKVDTANHYSVLYTFCSAANCTDGGTPSPGLIQDAPGNLYRPPTSRGA